MRYAFVSDIHGNLPAWNTVLGDIALRHIDKIVCLGDVIGYGPQPAQCLRSVYSRCAAMVLGNHDAVVGGRLTDEDFNDRARRVTAWTRTQLGTKACELFSRLPLVLKGEGWRCAHGDFVDPAAFGYISDEAEAAASFNAVAERLLFVGHTHRAAMFVVGASGSVYKLDPQDFQIEEGKRYIVNVGSVGSPRDGDPRASYVIYDDATQAVYFHRVPYDFEAFRQAVREAKGLNSDDVQLLRFVGEEGDASQRAEVDFAPSGNIRAEVDVVEADLTAALTRANRRFSRAVALFVLIFIAVVIAAVFYTRSVRSYEGVYPAEPYPALENASIAAADGNLFYTMYPRSSEVFECAPFQLRLKDTRSQRASVDNNGYAVFESESESLEMSFTSPLIKCLAGSRVEAMARVRFSADFVGSFILEAVLVGADGTHKSLFTKNFSKQYPSKFELPLAIAELPVSNGWLLAKGTSKADVPLGASGVVVSLNGKFKGSVTIGAISVRGR